MRRALLVLGLLLGPCLVAAPAPAALVDVAMNPYADYNGPGGSYSYGQTTIFRGLITYSEITVIPDILISDWNGGTGGADGVFSGFDLDFLVLDKDGDLSTTYDQYKPTSAVIVKQGVIRNQTGSLYQSTVANPGPLFGLKADGTLNALVATLGTRDANFVYGNMAVDTSYGWVSLGNGGQIRVSFGNVALDSSGMYLFLGEVGKRDEFANGKVQLDVPSSINHITMTLGGKYILHPGDVVVLSGLDGDSTRTWSWKINPSSTTYTDAYGPSLALSYEQLQSNFGFDTYYHWYTVSLDVYHTDGTHGYYTSEILLTPEPGTMTLMTIGAIGILLDRRRRRKAVNAAVMAKQVA